MEQPRPPALRAPAVVLAGALVLVGFVTLPVVAMLVLVFLGQRSRGYDGNLHETLTVGLPVLVGYLLAGALWLRSRRAGTVHGAWMLAALGVLVVVAVSFRPVAWLAYGFYEEWKETQPGGRGYYE